MCLKSQLKYNQHSLDIIALNGGFWFSVNDLGPCFGLSVEQMDALCQQTKNALTPDMTRVFEVERPDGKLEVSRIFSQQGVRVLAAQTTSLEVARFVRWLDRASCEQRCDFDFAFTGKPVSTFPWQSLFGHNHTAEERLMRANKGLQGVISLMSANMTHQFAIDTDGFATVLDLIRSELQAVIPAVQDR